MGRLVLPPWRTTALRLGLRSDGLIRSIYSRQCGPRCPGLDAAGVDAWRRPFQLEGAETGLWGMLAVGVPGLARARPCIATHPPWRSPPVPRQPLWARARSMPCRPFAESRLWWALPGPATVDVLAATAPDRRRLAGAVAAYEVWDPAHHPSP